MAQDKSPAKNIRDIKGQDKTDAPEQKPIPIVDGNIPRLTVITLDAINKNIIVLVQLFTQLLNELKGKQDGGPK